MVEVGLGIFGLIWLLFLTFGLAALVFWIWMIIDCATNEPSAGNDKLIWIVIIVFTNWIGALIYFFVRRPERIRQYGQ
jgi:hypothetical protein